MEIVGQAGTGHEALTLAVRHRAELVVLDLNMPELNGIDTASRIADLVPGAAVVMFSLTYSEPYLLRALAAGVRGFVAKDDGMEFLARAAEDALDGRYFLSPSITSQLDVANSAMFSPEAIAEILSTFDREARVVFDLVHAIAPYAIYLRETLLESFLAYAMARAAHSRITNVQNWLLLSAITFLFDKNVMPSVMPRTNVRFADVLNRWRTRLLNHPSQQALRNYWKRSEAVRSVSSLLEHLHECPSCHLEWGLFAMESVQDGDVAEFQFKTAEMQSVRSAIQATLQAHQFETLAHAWSARENRIRRVASSEMAILIGTGASREWALGASLESFAPSPALWAKQFVGSAAE